MRLKQLLFIVLISVFCTLPKVSSAQIDPPPNPVDVPIDGGLSILIGAGVAYGIKKVRDERKKQREEREGN